MFSIKEILQATGGSLVGKGRLEKIVSSISIDSRTIKQGQVFIAIKGNNFDGHNFIREAVKKGASLLIVSEKFNLSSFKLNIPALKVTDTQKALSDIALFHRQKFNIPIICVTGSNGKTTAKDMLSYCLAAKYNVLKNPETENNQIGTSLTLLRLNVTHEIAVLEIGTNHFGEIKRLAQIANPDIGIITNIGPSHLEFFDNLDGVLREKIDLVNNLKKNNIGILNIDDVFLKKVSDKIKNKIIINFGIESGCDFQASSIKQEQHKIKFLVNKKNIFEINTLGRFNIYNALCAISAARLFGLDYRTLYLRLKKFDFPKARLQYKRIKNFQIIDDSYNANPASLTHALDALRKYTTAGKKILVLGDMLELGKHEDNFHRRAAKDIVLAGINILITVGRASRLTAQTLKSLGFKDKKIHICQNIEDAKSKLLDSVTCDDVVLLKGSRRMQLEKIIEGL